MVGAAFAEDAIVSDVARRFDVAASQLYRWRGLYAARDQADAHLDFASVVVGEDVPLPSVPGVAPVARATAALRGIPVIVVEAGPPHAIWARVEIMGAASPKLVAATLAALKR
ncbi:MAG: transposase [Novosphingobium sp.]|nr:transposase [Novosphingobium sp.]